eukprot:TRINITY_DN74434_c0_g1_i1.p1 TRINITY_DN74434_c0_g1~~TRINITY_DN74434_c0_g1_i1.p1  ORF type:complete len:310 (-),score=50.90 TRINITY_DN74434_c0_g1_i1:397-1326(-)
MQVAGTFVSAGAASTQEICSIAAIAPAATLAISKFAPGAAFACCNIFIGYPFDTVKTRLQLQLHPDSKHCLKELGRGGPLALRSSLYRGASLPLFALVCKQPFEFAAFEYCSARWPGGFGATYLGGLLAGSVGALIACPFNVAKIFMQSQATSNTKASVSESLLRICGCGAAAATSTGGPTGNFAALPAMREAFKASLVFQVPFTTAFLGTYGAIREQMPRTSLCTATAGASAALFTWAVVLPLDVLRTRVQASAMSAVETGRPPKTLVAEFMSVLKSQGARGLWTGWGPISIRAITASISMTAYESLK